MARISGQAFAQSYIELHKVRSLQLGLLNPQEVQSISVVKIENERIYDERGIPNSFGINDPQLGTMDKEMKCYTCKGTQSECPGHFGHIELSQAVYHAGLLEYIRKVLRTVCFNCSKVLGDKQQLDDIRQKYKKAVTRFNRVFKLCDSIKECSECGHKQPKFQKSGLTIKMEIMDESYDQARDKVQILYPDQALRVLEKISDDDCIIMGFEPQVTKPEYMIIRNLAVAPPPVRPSVSMTNTMRSEDDLTYCYQKILQFNNILRVQMKRGANQGVINELRANLQYYVATLMDNEIQGQPTSKHKSGKPLKAIRSRLRGKEGRLRGNLMGKRVDFSARTVITPDPNLKLDQLGVPELIAMNLTVPETVTSENIDEMRKLVQNGPNTWPGAKYIIRHDDKQIDLGAMRNRSDAHLLPGYKVERHLRHDDYVIFNRQPSLHKMSLMGHRVRVLPFSTFRLNLSATSPYNADFDGDEMNMHVPQSYETMAEIKEIMAVPKQIVSPQSNKPVMGIVQDALLGVMIFTLKDTFIEIDLVMNLLMWINYDGVIPHPTIIKPKPLWTGKQLFSLIVPDINLERSPAKDKNGMVKWASAEDKNILISKGVLHCGIMTGGTIGKSAGGMIHVIWKEHGPDACRDFLSNVQLLINNWLYINGFTVGVQDIIATKDTLDQIRVKLSQYKRKMLKKLVEAQMGKLKSQPGKTMLESFEAKVNQTLNQARDKAGNLALDNLTTYNRLKAMVFAGSKGSNLNISQIMACVGQQNVEGKRIPFGFNKRSLPHFSKDDYGPESKGFVENCYLTGLTPSEFFFHAMGGREGLIDTAVKTAETGYIQRRLIKALEDVMVKYDGTVRTSKEQVIQFLYGEDGLAGEHIEDLTIDLLKQDNKAVNNRHQFIPDNVRGRDLEDLLKRSMLTQNATDLVNDSEMHFKLQEEFQQIRKDRDDLRTIILPNCDDSIHIGVNVPRLLWNAKEKFSITPKTKSDLKPLYVLESLEKIMENLTTIPGVKVRMDPLITEANENATWLFKIYLRQLLSTKNVIQTERLSQEAFDWLLGEIKSRFEQAIVNPGEMVGSIGAQSIGEPATQMTLNTFHNAGISSKNVTLGVPRVKEIINVAKNIKTPSMKIYLQNKYKKDNKQANKFGMKIEHTTLSDVVKNTAIYYDPDPKRTIISEDQDLVILYQEIPAQGYSEQKMSPWLLRFELDSEKMTFKNLLMKDIETKIFESFRDQVNIMYSDDNADKLILRIRVNDIEDDDEETVCMYLKEFEEKLLHDLSLKGIFEISKVTFSKYNDFEFNEETGECKLTKENWLVETDGVALQKILGFKKVNYQKTVSNDIIEILKVLGIEAARMSLVNELRFVLSSYGIYVNYRHLATLCDIMTNRGILTSITRHGINRVDTGPLRKCSFEETVEILLEAAVFSEIDPLKGITENIIMGQLAPYGTGSFGLVIDKDALDMYAQSKNIEEDLIVGQATPMQNNDLIDDGNGLYNAGQATPIAGMTPAYNFGGASEYNVGNTPNYIGGFSPGPNQIYSPQQSPNPQMSPGYNSIKSPIYSAGQGNMYGGTTSGGGSFMTPIYTSAQRSPGQMIGQNYSPTQNVLYGSTSPVQNSSLGQNSSSGYSPSQQYSNHGNNYTPSGMQRSPAYSPTIGNYGSSFSPSYSPSSPSYGSSTFTRGAYQPTTPRYQMTSTTTLQQQSQMYAPQTPAYNPNPDAYQQTRGNTTNDQQQQQQKEETKKN